METVLLQQAAAVAALSALRQQRAGGGLVPQGGVRLHGQVIHD